MPNYLFVDTETHNAGREYGHDARTHFRLGQYAWDDGPVVLTTDYDEFVEVVRAADYVVGHNIIGYDLSYLFGVDSLEPLQMCLDNKVLDTFTIASMITPAPYSYRDSAGHYFKDAAKPGNAMRYLSLDNLAFQFGLPGKVGSLQDLAKKYNPPKTLVAKLDYGLIPVDDPEFREYAEGDIIAVRALWNYLQNQIKVQDYNRDYLWRELLLAGITARMTNNGLRVNVERAQERVDQLAEERERVMAWLVDEYEFPTEGKAPWSSNAGKEVIFKVLADYGVTEYTRPDWERTATGNLSLGGKVIIELTEGTDLEAFGRSLSTLKGQRSLAQLALDSMHPDGLVHPSILPLQRSRRWSVTKPGLTVVGSNDDEDAGIIRTQDKEYYIADPGYVLAELDFAAADARAMAALSGDPEFLKRFEEDADGNMPDAHNMSGVAFFGEEEYYKRMDPKGKPLLRTPTKPGGHGQNYNLGAFKMAHMLNKACREAGIDLHFWAPKHPNSKSTLLPIEERPDSIDTRDMIARFNSMFAWLKRFKDQAVREAEVQGYIENSWGCRMPVDPGREWTQAPALYGQSSTREMMGDALIRIVKRNIEYARWLKLIIHDALVVQLPEETVESDVLIVKDCMEAVFDPGTEVSVPLLFPVGYGYGKTWRDATHN